MLARRAALLSSRSPSTAAASSSSSSSRLVSPSVPSRSVSRYQLPSPWTLNLSHLRPAPGSVPKKFIKGRGIGSGLGKTAGKGHKGQWARNAPPDWFEGGQTPIYRRVRKFGFKNRFRRPLVALNLRTVQSWVDRGIFAAGQTVTMRDMIQKKLVTSIKHGVKLLATGKETFASSLTLEVTAVSKAAKEAVEGVGGTVRTVYFNKLGIRTFTLKAAEDISIQFAAAPPKKAHRYDVPKYELKLPGDTPPRGVSYNTWQRVLRRTQEMKDRPVVLRARTPKKPAPSSDDLAAAVQAATSNAPGGAAQDPAMKAAASL